MYIYIYIYIYIHIYIYIYIYWFLIIPIDELIFFRGVGFKPPTRKKYGEPLGILETSKDRWIAPLSTAIRWNIMKYIGIWRFDDQIPTYCIMKRRDLAILAILFSQAHHASDRTLPVVRTLGPWGWLGWFMAGFTSKLCGKYHHSNQICPKIIITQKTDINMHQSSPFFRTFFLGGRFRGFMKGPYGSGIANGRSAKNWPRRGWTVHVV